MESVPSLMKFKSRKEWEQFVWQHITKALAGENSSEVVDKSLSLLITESERGQIIRRAAAISLLKQGKSYGMISKLLWLSPSTISALRKSLRGEEGYVSNYLRRKKGEKVFKRLSKKEWARLRFKLWLETFFTLPPPILPAHPRSLASLLKTFSKPNRYRR